MLTAFGLTFIVIFSCKSKDFFRLYQYLLVHGETTVIN
jgi:hypothetical protein